MVREFLAAYVKSVEGIGAIGAVFEQVFFALGEFFAGFILAEAVAPAADPCRLNGENQVLVVGAVKEWHEALLTCEALVDEQVFFIVTHRVSKIDGFHLPAPALKFVDYPPTVILFVYGIVRAEGRSIVIIDHGLVAMLRIVTAEVFDESRNLTLEFDVKRLDDVKAAVAWLTGDNPVDVGVVVHADANRRVGVNVLVGASIERREVIIIAESIEVLIIVGIVLVPLAH